MQVRELVNEGLIRSYIVTIPYSEVDARADVELGKMSKEAKIPGFRPGKVPVAYLKKKYGTSVIQDVVQDIIRDSGRKAIEEKGLRAAYPPSAELISFVPDKELEFKISLEIFPEIPEIEFSAVELTEYKAEPSEKEISEALDRIAKANRTLSDAAEGHKAASGDTVVIDFTGYLNGEKFQGGASEDFSLELGSGQFIPGFEDQLIGGAAGEERRIKVTFPEAYGSKDLAGKDAEFEVKIHKIKVSATPELNDDFAKNLMGADATIESIKDLIKAQIKKEFDITSRLKLKRDLFDYLDGKLNFQIPIKMMEVEKKSIMERLQKAKEEKDPSVNGKSDEQLEAEYTKISERRVRLGLFLSETGRRAEIKVTEQELRMAMFKQAQNYPGQERKVMEFYQKHPEYLEDLRGPIYEDKVVDYIAKNLKLTAQVVSIDELEKLYIGDALGMIHNEDLPVTDGAHDIITPHVHDENCGHNH